MLAPRWRKVLRDLWNNKSRSLLVVLSIAVGVAAVGMIASTYLIITEELPASYQGINPAHARILTSKFDDELIYVLRNIEFVKQIEGRNNLSSRMQIGPDTWRDLQLTVYQDFNDININKITRETGKWPPAEGEIILERASLPLTRAEVGDSILIQTPNGQQRQLKIVGLAHDLSSPAGTFTNVAQGYISDETLEKFGIETGYNELLITVIGDAPNQEYIRTVTKEIESKIEKSGRSVFGTIIPDPGKHWFESFLNPMAALLLIIGLTILLLSTLLVINTITAILARQARQIGMMKAVGARTFQILLMYETSILIIGLLALLIAIPLGFLGTRAIISIVTGIINFDVAEIKILPSILGLQMVLSVVVPMAVVLLPIFSGSKVTVHQALNDYGLGKSGFGGSWVDRLIGYIKGLPRPLLLSLRNTFRRKTRLTLTLIALSLGSAIFIAVLSVYAGLMATLDEALSYYEFDIVISLSRPYRIEQVNSELSVVTGIRNAEPWGITSARLRFPDGSETNTMTMLAPPTETALINPVLIDGRWLLPEDDEAVVVNSEVLREFPEIKVGDEITINLDGTLRAWQVVGIVRSVLTGPLLYVNYPYFTQVTGRYGLASAIYVSIENRAPESQVQMAKTIEDHFESVGINVASSNIVADLRSTATTQFNVIIAFLLLMAIMLTVVGGFGLTGTMSLNVLERTREIGVMRAIGASNGNIFQIVIVEGILIGIISWFIGAILAYPLGILISNVVGSGFLQTAIRFVYSTAGAGIWLVVVIILSVLASTFPARNAISLTVRDVLSYE